MDDDDQAADAVTDRDAVAVALELIVMSLDRPTRARLAAFRAQLMSGQQEALDLDLTQPVIDRAIELLGPAED